MIVALVNPAVSSRRSADLIVSLAGSSPRLRLVVTDRADDVAGFVQTLDRAEAELLVVGGGDGTLAHLLTEADRLGRLERLPPLVVLPAGHLNITARALVGTQHPAELADRIVHAWTRGVRRLRRVPVLAVDVAGERQMVGVTASLGAVARLHKDYETLGAPGRATAGRLLLRIARQRTAAQRFRPIRAVFETDQGTVPMHGVSAGVMSSLPAFFPGVTPFRGREAVSRDGLFTLLTSLGSMAMQASLLPLLSGRLPRGGAVFESRVQHLAWRNPRAQDLVVIDGEMVNVQPDAAVRIGQVGRVRMMVWKPMPRSDARAG